MPQKQPKRFSLFGPFRSAACEQSNQEELAAAEKAQKEKTEIEIYSEMLDKATGKHWIPPKRSGGWFYIDVGTRRRAEAIADRLNTTAYKPEIESKFFVDKDGDLAIGLPTLNLIPCNFGAFVEGNLVDCFDEAKSRELLMNQKLGIQPSQDPVYENVIKHCKAPVP